MAVILCGITLVVTVYPLLEEFLIHLADEMPSNLGHCVNDYSGNAGNNDDAI